MSTMTQMSSPYFEFTYIAPLIRNEFSLVWQTYDGVSDYQDVLKFIRADPPYIQTADLEVLNDKFIRIGKDSDGSLPTPSVDYRGKMIRVENATGDKVYICEWNGSAYVWREI